VKTTFLIIFMCLGLIFCSSCSKDQEEQQVPEKLSKQEMPVSSNLTNEQKVAIEMKNALEAAGEEYRNGSFKKSDTPIKQEPKNAEQELTNEQKVAIEMKNALEAAGEEYSNGSFKK
jgi:phage terminase Nu1 subunit (DNA packaging protein)